MIKNILVAIDFSEGSRAALHKASELAVRTGAELMVLHADEFPVAPAGELPYLPSRMIEQHADQVRQRLDALVRELAERGTRARPLCVVGPAHRVILDVAKEASADLIVMGTHGRRGVRRLLVGSVAERVARTSQVPVLAVHVAPLG